MFRFGKYLCFLVVEIVRFFVGSNFGKWEAIV